MKKISFVQRHADPRSGLLVPVERRRPFRLWMTGSLAVVMAAVIPMRDLADVERSEMMRVLRQSRYGVGETVQRIEVAARDRGLSVLALMPGTRPVLVLASSVGGTPVVMADADSSPAMPLSVMVRERGDGGAEVLVAAAARTAAVGHWPDLPAAVVDDLRALPALVDRALT
jgi:uncharacterized protein (DUF302 family)